MGKEGKSSGHGSLPPHVTRTITDFINAAGKPGNRVTGSTARRDRRVCVAAVREGEKGKEAGTVQLPPRPSMRRHHALRVSVPSWAGPEA